MPCSISSFVNYRFFYAVKVYLCFVLCKHILHLFGVQDCCCLVNLDVVKLIKRFSFQCFEVDYKDQSLFLAFPILHINLARWIEKVPEEWILETKSYRLDLP